MSPPAGAAPVRRQRATAPQPEPSRGTPRRHLRVAPERTQSQRRARRAVSGIPAFSIASLVLLGAFHVVAVQHAFELDRLAEQRADEERRYERLREQVATLSAPEAIVAAAQRLGMVPAERVNAIQAPPAAPRGE